MANAQMDGLRNLKSIAERINMQRIGGNDPQFCTAQVDGRDLAWIDAVVLYLKNCAGPHAVCGPHQGWDCGKNQHPAPNIKIISTNLGYVYVCEMCSSHWFQGHLAAGEKSEQGNAS